MTVLASLLQLGRQFRVIIARCDEVVANVFNPYRPELYYMRGPGPKWHARRRASRLNSDWEV